MPIYEYYCPKCKSKFELLRRFSQAGEAASCPNCKESSEKVMSRCSSMWKGAGGYTSPMAGSSGCSSCGSSNCSSCHS